MATNTEKIVVQVVVKGQKGLDKVGKSADKGTKSFGKMAAGVLAAVAAFKQINQIVANSIKSFRDFEFQMAKVKAITGANRTEFLQLSKSAQDLGRSTFFTAQQVAELQTNYGKLGFTTTEILNAQEATLHLATATDTDLARAAIVAGSAVRGFGLDASETQRVVDVMAVSFTSSSMDIEKWQTSMTKVAPIAKAAGFSIEDTAAIMSQLSDSGIEASIAGTSLRNIFLKMQDPNSDLVKSFGKTIHSLDDLVPALAKFSEEGGDLVDVMGVVNIRQAAAFEQMITSRERTLLLRDALKDASGAAEEMARIVGDTLEGAMKRTESAWQGLQIGFVDKFGEAMKNTTDMFANLINKITDFIETPISEKVNKDRIAMNDLFNALKETNISQDTRNKLITKLNLQYGEYLPNIVTEKTSLENLKKAQVEANAAMLQRVTILAAEEKLTEIRKRQIDNQIAAADLIVEKQKLEREGIEALATTNDRLQTSRQGVDLEVSNATIGLIDNTAALNKNKKEAEELSKEYEIAANVALELGVDVDKVMQSLEASTENTKSSTAATVANTKAKKDNALETSFLSSVIDDYWNTLMEGVLDGTETMEGAEQKLADFQKELIENLLLDEQLSYEQKVKLQKQLTALKLADNERTLESQRVTSEQKLALMQEASSAIFAIMSNNAAASTSRDIEALQKQKDAGLLTEEEYEKKVEGIQRKAFERKKRMDIAQAIINGALAMTKTAAQTGVLAFAFSPFIAAMTALQIAVIASQKFAQGGMIEEFANGGMVHGKSHAQGGEKFAVGGRVVELEGGEAVINKRSTAMFSKQLSAMNAAGGGVKFADGGLLNMPSFSQQQFNAIGQNQMMGAMGSSSKVVVVEADITDSQNSVSVIQSEATI